jgi:ABC-type multidrug transport system permease subunit
MKRIPMWVHVVGNVVSLTILAAVLLGALPSSWLTFGLPWWAWVYALLAVIVVAFLAGVFRGRHAA